MLKISRFSRRRVAILAALLGVCCSSPSLWAQENTAVTTAASAPLNLSNHTERKRFEELAPGTTTQVLIPVRNVRASLIAYWLDPAHQPTPIDLQVSRSFGGGTQLQYAGGQRLPGNGNGPVGLKLPEGVARIFAIDPQNDPFQNGLLAFGTKEGLEALDKLVPTLDVPLRQYEIEAQFLQMSRADLAQLGLNFVTFAPKEAPYIASVAKAPNIEPTIIRLVGEKRIKVLTAPRVTVIDGLTGQLEQTMAVPVVTDEEALKAKKGNTTQETTPEDMQSIAYLTTSIISLRATASQVKKGLISLSVTPTYETRTMSISTVVRDGESFAIQWSNPKEKQQVIIVVTLRALRRVGDTE